jgi:ABC-type multidrug transport system ATPase subunit
VVSDGGQGDLAAELSGIVKRFGDLIANDDVDLALARGEVHALLGENGAGKTTLMRILYGLTRADAGSIRIEGRAVSIQSPRDAIAAGVGMVTQHFSLVQPMTVTENVILGRAKGTRLDLAAARRAVGEASQRFGIAVRPDARVQDLSVGEQQRVEILKALYRGASLIILDEPTAVLTPQEVNDLFETLKRMVGEGHGLVFISHKLHEVMAISDRVSALRDGRMIGTRPTNGVTRDELVRMMVGREIKPLDPQPIQSGAVRLRIQGLRALGDRGTEVLRGVELEVRCGEIDHDRQFAIARATARHPGGLARESATEKGVSKQEAKNKGAAKQLYEPGSTKLLLTELTPPSQAKATQPPIVSIETSSNRSHIGRGTLNFCRRQSANSASATAPTMPHRPREDNGGHSDSKCFMIGKLRPHPTDVTASRTSPSGDSRPARSIGDMAGLDPEPEVHLFSF